MEPSSRAPRHTLPPASAAADPTAVPTTPSATPPAARSRLIQAGLRLFAAQGFAKTSTRELADAAGVNVASIAYYFGDKAGLYRAVFFEPLASTGDEAAALRDHADDPSAALRLFYAAFLEPLKRSEEARLCVKLHFREMLEPTQLWQQAIACEMRPTYDAMVELLVRHLGVDADNRDLHRLALSLVGLGVYLHVAGDIFDALAPDLMADAVAIDHWAERLQSYALAMIDAERRRLAASAGAAT